MKEYQKFKNYLNGGKYGKAIRLALIGAAVIILIPPPDLEFVIAGFIGTILNIKYGLALLITYALAAIILYLLALPKLKKILKKISTGFK